ncbi:MurT ligase domain-containing protein [Ruminococcus sp. 5_1_39BFAA]|uniref:MurT ligase domain-containing protein n=1 Tax=Ruminococcus sp. 5_1_39BFAA TaxID=457412 RepID=UPI0035623B82
MKIRTMAAVCAAKFAGFACRKMGRQGVTWAGKIALKIDPHILEELSGQVREKIFVVCGTNGKTTTNNMLCAALEAEGKKVICNHTGSNMLNGVVAAFVLASGLGGKVDADYACIEVDEASTRHVFPAIKPDYMVMTNLFRDQLDRYGEIDITMNILEEMIRKVPKMKVIVNGDDALSAYLAMDSGNEFVTYGISKPVMKNETNEIREGRFCKCCGERLIYSFYHYSQLGDYKCPKCGFARPEIQYDADDVKVDDQISFRVEGRQITANYKGFYNVYNILAAYAGVRTAGFAAEHFNDMLKRFNPENGRMEQFRIRGCGVTLNLAKNPAGFNQNISAVMQDKNPKDIIITINDNAQDGTDISWLWDVDFDRLRDESIKSITVSGIRCQDMRLRMKYVDIPSMLEGDVEKAIRARIEDGVGNLYVLVNYTALFSTRNILKRMEGEKE